MEDLQKWAAPPNREQMARAKMDTLKQKDKDTLFWYEHEFRSLALQTWKMPDAEMKHLFAKGLKDDIRLRMATVAGVGSMSYDEYVQKALELETERGLRRRALERTQRLHGAADAAEEKPADGRVSRDLVEDLERRAQ